MSYTVAEERMQNYIDELEQENRLLRARNDRLEAEVKAAPVQEPLIPEGWSLVAVTGFDQLMYWLDRCERKGHLENCPDLIEPYEAFDYRLVTTTPPTAQRPWVGLTDDAKLDLISDAKGIGGRVRSDAQLLVLLYMQEAKLKEKNS
jgi:hypothetical protein